MPVGQLSVKTAIVTGGGRGLGHVTTLGLARTGANAVTTAAATSSEIDAVANAVSKRDLLTQRDHFQDQRD